MYTYLSKISSPKDIKNFNKKETIALACELRDMILHTVSQNGGHLSSNLGIVELTLGLHQVFDSPQDQIVFDVSHQAYVHKLLTGRYDQFQTLRQYKGLSGFTKRHESEHDVFEAGHASTSISAALGLAKARDLLGLNHHVIAVIGDGALTGGMAFEALNHLGHDRTRMIVILNDNDMSISENVGGLNRYLDKIRTTPGYFKVKDEVHHLLEKIPAVGKTMTKSLSKIKESVKQMVVPGMLFEELGLTYLGVVDGHDVKAIKQALSHAKNVDGPVLIHVKTIKGKGYRHAEERPGQFHGIGQFDLTTGQVIGKSGSKSFSDVFGDELCQMAKEDKRICAVTAAMPSGTGLDPFKSQYSNRCFDVGIAEEHAVTFSAGLARNGMRPYFAVYSTFLQRGYDQMIHDVCLQDLPVTFCIDRAGLVGNDGETHHGCFDLSFMLAMPHLHIFAPTDGNDLRAMMRFAANHDGPVAIRYPRGSAYGDSHQLTTSLEPELYTSGNDFTLVAVGKMHHTAIEAAKLLSEQGLCGCVITPKRLKPLDAGWMNEHIVGGKPLFVLEDNMSIGGYCAYLERTLNNQHGATSVTSLGLPDDFVTHGDTHELFEMLGLDPKGVAKQIKDFINERKN